MLFSLHGRRAARIKKYTDAQHQCKNCKSFDLEVKVYRDYYHFMFIPIVPVGDKTAKIFCNNCGDGLRTESVRQEYEKKTKTPFYFYTLPILVVLVIAIAFIADRNDQKQMAKYIAEPKAGDIYTLSEKRDNLTIYYFLRIKEIRNDSIYLYQNNLEYFLAPTEFDDSDFFRETGQMAFSIQEFKMILDTGNTNIYSVTRRYNKDAGYNRVK
ncbi:MAG: hypothetical protein ABIR18_02585 [Chitinophagaceae bacterium]